MHSSRATLWLSLMYGAILVVALLYTVAPPWGEQADIWETAATIDAVSQSPLDPRNPLLDLPGETSPRFTPFTILWGMIDRLLNLPLFTTVAVAGLFNLVLFLSGFARVICTITNDARAMLWILPVMLLGWGHGYGEANGYQAELFFSTLPYVGMFTYGLCFHGIAELNRYLVSGSRLGLILYGALGVLAFLTHPITAMLLFVGAFAWAVVRGSYTKTLLLQLVPLVALGSCWLWPYFDYPTLLFRGTSENWYQVRLFDDQLTKVGPALLGILVAIYFVVRRKFLEPAIALGCSLAIYLLSWTLDIQIGSRFIFYGAIFAHICIGLYLWESGLLTRDFLKQPRFRIAFVLLLALAVFVPGTYYRARKMEKQWSPIVAHYELSNGDILEPWQDMDFLRAKLDGNSVVMVEDTVGWRLPAVTGAKLVAQAKGDPLIQEQVNLRRTEATAFFNTNMSLADRWLLLNKYHCTHILVDERHAERNHHSLKQDLSTLTDLVAVRSPYRLYLVKNSN